MCHGKQFPNETSETLTCMHILSCVCALGYMVGCTQRAVTRAWLGNLCKADGWLT